MHKYVPPPIAVGQSTDVGRRRHENQDSMGYTQLDRFAYKGAHLVICCDGMGGASGGQQASSTAVEHILEYFKDGHPSPEPDIAIREAVEKAAEAVHEKAQADPRLEGMGTTCVVVVMHNGYLFAGHIGDSRLYLWRNGEMIRLSRDHSRVQFMVEAGIITEEEAKKHPHQNFLARVLGSNQQPRVELLAPPRKMQLGDRLLLCSDGLYNEVEEDVMAEVISQNEPQAATEKLVKLANENGGNDNITVQIVSYGDIQPQVTEEAWFQFARPSHGAMFYVACCVLFFLLGFFSGRTGQQAPAPARTYKSGHSHKHHHHHDHARTKHRHTHRGHSHGTKPRYRVTPRKVVKPHKHAHPHKHPHKHVHPHNHRHPHAHPHPHPHRHAVKPRARVIRPAVVAPRLVRKAPVVRRVVLRKPVVAPRNRPVVRRVVPVAAPKRVAPRPIQPVVRVKPAKVNAVPPVKAAKPVKKAPASRPAPRR